MLWPAFSTPTIKNKWVLPQLFLNWKITSQLSHSYKQKACYPCHSAARAEGIRKPAETEGAVQERQQHWTLMLEILQNNSAVQSRIIVSCSLLWAILVFWGCGPTTSRQSCVWWDSWHTVAQSLLAQLLPPSSLILCPLALPELGRKFCFLTLSPILSRNIQVIHWNLLSAESIEEARLGWCRRFVAFSKLICSDCMWLASRVCIAQPPAAALHGCLRKS